MVIILTSRVESPAPLGGAALDDSPDDHLVPLIPHGGAQRLIVLGDLDHPGVGDGLQGLLGGLVLGPHLGKALGPGQSSLQLGQLVVGVEQSFELNLVENVQYLRALGEVTLLQGNHALKTIPLIKIHPVRRECIKDNCWLL